MSAILMEEAVKSDLKKRLGGLRCELWFGEPMSAYTTFQVGGPADVLALPRDESELEELVERCTSEELESTVIGGGANTLVLDGGVRGVVISLSKGFRQITLEEAPGETARIESGAGVKIPALVRFATAGGWEGMECLSGVPGTVGGALAMNAGTGKRFIEDSVESIRWIRLSQGGVERLLAGEIQFGYRTALFPEPGIVTSICFRVIRKDSEKLRTFLQADAKARRERQPWGMPCAGSIFRNPPGDFAGRLIESAGLKGRRIGGAEVSEVHGNFIVNRGGAKAADVLRLIDEIRAEVKRKHHTELELELRVIGEEAE